jgi:hypothetical protein
MDSAARIYAMLGNETLWDATRTAHELLKAEGIPHAIAGGVAVCLHGYQRNTIDVDMLVRKEDSQQIRAGLQAAGWSWSQERAEFLSPGGIILQFLLAGQKSGSDAEVYLPDPADEHVVTIIEELPVLTLARLIESKIACGESSLRRTHKDFADVVELIVVHNLSRSFAKYLHKSLRETFRQLVMNARNQRT